MHHGDDAGGFFPRFIIRKNLINLIVRIEDIILVSYLLDDVFLTIQQIDEVGEQSFVVYVVFRIKYDGVFYGGGKLQMFTELYQMLRTS